MLKARRSALSSHLSTPCRNQSCTAGWNTSNGHPGDTAIGGHTTLNTTAGGWDTDQWHEYAVEWDGRGRVAFVVDGATILNISRLANRSSPTRGNSRPQFSGVPFYLILNTAVGGPWPKPVSSRTAFPWLHYIDYVRCPRGARGRGGRGGCGGAHSRDRKCTHANIDKPAPSANNTQQCVWMPGDLSVLRWGGGGAGRGSASCVRAPTAQVRVAQPVPAAGQEMAPL